MHKLHIHNSLTTWYIYKIQNGNDVCCGNSGNIEYARIIWTKFISILVLAYISHSWPTLTKPLENVCKDFHSRHTYYMHRSAWSLAGVPWVGCWRRLFAVYVIALGWLDDLLRLTQPPGGPPWLGHNYYLSEISSEVLLFTCKHVQPAS